MACISQMLFMYEMRWFIIALEQFPCVCECELSESLHFNISFAEGVTGLNELAFLRDLAEQNSAKYGVPDRTALPVVKGSMMVLNQLSNLETTVGRFYTHLQNHMIDEAVFSLPFSDEMGEGKPFLKTS